MNARTLALLALLAATALATPIIQATKAAQPVTGPGIAPNTFDVQLTYRVVEEDGEDSQERFVLVTDSLPESVELVSGELVSRRTITSVEADADPEDGWDGILYRIRASKVAFSVVNQSVLVVLPPVHVSVTATQDPASEVIVSKASAPARITVDFPLLNRGKLLFVVGPISVVMAISCFHYLSSFLSFFLSFVCAHSADFKYLTPVAYVATVVLPLLLAMFFVKVCAAKPVADAKKKN